MYSTVLADPPWKYKEVWRGLALKPGLRHTDEIWGVLKRALDGPQPQGEPDWSNGVHP